MNLKGILILIKRKPLSPNPWIEFKYKILKMSKIYVNWRESVNSYAKANSNQNIISEG